MEVEWEAEMGISSRGTARLRDGQVYRLWWSGSCLDFNEKYCFRHVENIFSGFSLCGKYSGAVWFIRNILFVASNFPDFFSLEAKI